MLVLAHLSDPHIGPLPALRILELAGKRVTGFVNWRRVRRFRHQESVLAALIADLKAQAPDHIAVTGDLANLGLPGEFAAGRVFLDSLGEPRNVTLVPGNHDIYVRAAIAQSRSHWAEFMRGDGATNGVVFPFVRRRGDIALIGLSSAVPTRPFMATGLIGREQLANLSEVLRALDEERVFRVVLLHHPPQSRPGKWSKRLIDAADLRAVLARDGAELVLHGHDHEHALVWLDGPRAKIPAVGVPSASMTPEGHEPPAAYNLYLIEGKPGAWSCEIVSRGLKVAGGAFGEISRRALTAV